MSNEQAAKTNEDRRIFIINFSIPILVIYADNSNSENIAKDLKEKGYDYDIIKSGFIKKTKQNVEMTIFLIYVGILGCDYTHINIDNLVNTMFEYGKELCSKYNLGVFLFLFENMTGYYRKDGYLESKYFINGCNIHPTSMLTMNDLTIICSDIYSKMKNEKYVFKTIRFGGFNTFLTGSGGMFGAVRNWGRHRMRLIERKILPEI